VKNIRGRALRIFSVHVVVRHTISTNGSAFVGSLIVISVHFSQNECSIRKDLLPMIERESLVAFLPEDGINGMPSNWTIEGKSLSCNSCNVVHGSNKRRSKNLESGSVFD